MRQKSAILPNDGYEAECVTHLVKGDIVQSTRSFQLRDVRRVKNQGREVRQPKKIAPKKIGAATSQLAVNTVHRPLIDNDMNVVNSKIWREERRCFVSRDGKDGGIRNVADDHALPFTRGSLNNSLLRWG
ncbi:MAG: hypothetical protein AW09_000698 [Candidatus Accumulibacter phosphatis]|uniref:Uncharacterized protein n=1 Tax=Candidatus Accumulibacter phosphatis TaxID=327160 RepID=A0A080LZ21_9PROT|nr:MAG: hypothetical protein AW09_000698 [Candidatus Accumulibacter phosphatis]